MSIKKLLLSALLLTTTGFAYAEETDDYIEVQTCTLVAGQNKTGEGYVNIKLVNTDKDWCALQFDLDLPPYIKLDEVADKVMVPTDRCKFTYTETVLVWDEDEGEEVEQEVEKTGDFILEYNAIDAENGIYRFLAYNMKNGKFSDGANDAIFSIRLYALDRASTTSTATIKNAILSKTSNSANVSGADCPIKDTDFTIQINANIGTGGYGSFSWPRDVDFSAYKDVKVYTATGGVVDGWLTLDELENKLVPGGTGVFIKGTAGTTLNPTTLKEEEGLAKIETPSIGQTSAKTYTVKAGDNIYALATKSKTALYPVDAGVKIPKYKAYLIYDKKTAEGAKFISFGDTATSIEALDMAEEEGDIYTLGGQKVQKTTMKGVYIKNGKKVVVK